MSVALKQYEEMIAERIRELPPEEALHTRRKLMDNPTLNNYYSREGKLCVTLDDEIVDELPCERLLFEYPRTDPKEPSHWQLSPRGQVNMARTRDGDLWAHVKSGPIFHSADAGRTWDWTAGSSTTESDDFAFTVLANDAFIVAGSTEASSRLLVHHSLDLGRSWELIATIDPPYPYVVIGDDTPGMTQLADGTILFTVAADMGKNWDKNRGQLLCRSSDEGLTWSLQEVSWDANAVTDDAPPFPAHSAIAGEPRPDSSESHILELRSGKLLHTIRWQLIDPAYGGARGWEHVSKTVGYLDSEDGGRTWENARPTLDKNGKPVLVCGECHGQSAQLSDGRIITVHDRRYPHRMGEVVAHVSDDEGATWDRRAFHVSNGTGYPAVTVLEDGTIVVVAGSSLLDDNGQALASRSLWTSTATRWKLPT